MVRPKKKVKKKRKKRMQVATAARPSWELSNSTQLRVELSSEKKWFRIWDEVAERMLRLPLWMQQIILDDIGVAVQNRILVMERIQKKKVSR